MTGFGGNQFFKLLAAHSDGQRLKIEDEQLRKEQNARIALNEAYARSNNAAAADRQYNREMGDRDYFDQQVRAREAEEREQADFKTLYEEGLIKTPTNKPFSSEDAARVGYEAGMYYKDPNAKTQSEIAENESQIRANDARAGASNRSNRDNASVMRPTTAAGKAQIDKENRLVYAPILQQYMANFGYDPEQTINALRMQLQDPTTSEDEKAAALDMIGILEQAMAGELDPEEMSMYGIGLTPQGVHFDENRNRP